MLILLADTNFFLQYRNPAELPWADIGADDEVVLKVCRAVLREIDNFKAGGQCSPSAAGTGPVVPVSADGQGPAAGDPARSEPEGGSPPSRRGRRRIMLPRLRWI